MGLQEEGREVGLSWLTQEGQVLALGDPMGKVPRTKEKTHDHKNRQTLVACRLLHIACGLW